MLSSKDYLGALVAWLIVCVRIVGVMCHVYVCASAVSFLWLEQSVCCVRILLRVNVSKGIKFFRRGLKHRGNIFRSSTVCIEK